MRRCMVRPSRYSSREGNRHLRCMPGRGCGDATDDRRVEFLVLAHASVIGGRC
jgi:hypothetical protein